jgi:heterodisulfide reductase subunit B
MKVSYYPGCTFKTKAKNLVEAAVASMEKLGVEMGELSRWNCCGAVHSLSDDDLIHQIAPARVLIRAMEEGSNRLITLCSMCYNSLARANLLMRNDEEKRNTINLFMDEEPDYHGEVEVVHLLSFLKDEIGWDAIAEKIERPLKGLKIAPYYGCTLQRPREIGIEEPGSFKLMTGLLVALGADIVKTPVADLCCGSYQILGNPDAALNAVSRIIGWSDRSGADALAMSCPLCEFNIGKKQDDLIKKEMILKELPVFYFTQLLGLALGIDLESLHLELNGKGAEELLKAKNVI